MCSKQEVSTFSRDDLVTDADGRRGRILGEVPPYGEGRYAVELFGSQEKIELIDQSALKHTDEGAANRRSLEHIVDEGPSGFTNDELLELGIGRGIAGPLSDSYCVSEATRLLRLLDTPSDETDARVGDLHGIIDGTLPIDYFNNDELLALGIGCEIDGPLSDEQVIGEARERLEEIEEDEDDESVSGEEFMAEREPDDETDAAS